MLLAQALGLLVGAIFWAIACDVWVAGKISAVMHCRALTYSRWFFNLTILLTTVFALAAGAAPNYTTLCACVCMWSIGVSGNLSVDLTVFLGVASFRALSGDVQFMCM